MKGLYKGFYKYDNERIQKSIAHGLTFFSIEITESNGQMFKGTVQDDPFTGGTPGVGTISGELIGDKISFTKQMPIASFLSNGQMKTYDRSHPKIYYTGILSNGKFTGSWKIKLGFFKAGLVIMLGAKTTGTWEMEKAVDV